MNDMNGEKFRNVQNYMENNSIKNITIRNIIYREYSIVATTEDADFVPIEIMSSEKHENVNRTTTPYAKRER